MQRGRTVHLTTRRRLLRTIGLTAGIGGSLASLPVSATRSTGQVTSGSWPQFQFDDANTGNGRLNRGPDGPAGPRLAVDAGQQIVSAPAVRNDLLYVVDNRGEVLRAIDRTNGTERWAVEADLSGAWPAVYGDTVYLPGGNVVALDASDGTEKWEASIGGTAHGVVDNGSTVVAAGSRGVTAFRSSSGSERWHFDAVSSWREPPAVVGNDVFAVDSMGGTIVSLHIGGGNRQWLRRFDGPAPGTPTVVDNHVIVPGAGTVHAFRRSTGVTEWETHVDFETTVAAAEGLAYGVTGTELVALAVDSGTEQWRTPIPTTTNPPVIAGGTLYLAGDDGDVVAVDPTSGTIRWQSAVDAEFRSAFAVAGGELYVGTRDGTLHALAAGHGQAAETQSEEETTEAPTEAPAEQDSTPAVTEEESEGANDELLAFLGTAGLLAALVARGQKAFSGDADDE